MFAYLTIDQGNSSTKAALWQGGRVTEKFCMRADASDALERLVAACEAPIKAAVCRVGDAADDLAGALAPRVESVIDLSCHTPVPLDIAYSTPETLGADRIAAAVGARALYPGAPLLVADIGSASTFDYVTADDRYMGGNISPGLGMRLRALHSFTARLPLVDAMEGPVARFGRDTREALRSGAVYGVVAELEFYARQLPVDGKVVVTGGWADTIARHTSLPCDVNHDLVLVGLKNIIAYNEAIDK